MRYVPLTLAFWLMAAPAHADDPVASTELGRGHAAWLRGDFEAARDLFAAAIERGNLLRSELLDAYIALGSAWTVFGQKDRALGAFRNAALIDQQFKVPEEFGKKAIQLSDTARKQAAKIGQITLQVEHAPFAPDTATDISVKIDAAQSVLVTKLALRAESGRESSELEQATATELVFHLPKALVNGDTVALSIRGLDAHGSEVVKYSETATVAGAVPRKGSRGALTTSSDNGGASESKSKFWSSPWPYVIGGAVLVGAATTAVYFWKFAPVDQVEISKVQVHALH